VKLVALDVANEKIVLVPVDSFPVEKVIEKDHRDLDFFPWMEGRMKLRKPFHPKNRPTLAVITFDLVENGFPFMITASDPECTRFGDVLQPYLEIIEILRHRFDPDLPADARREIVVMLLTDMSADVDDPTNRDASLTDERRDPMVRRLSHYLTTKLPR
jgi:hypothetical protein